VILRANSFSLVGSWKCNCYRSAIIGPSSKSAYLGTRTDSENWNQKSRILPFKSSHWTSDI
jgi:hypothetical protein